MTHFLDSLAIFRPPLPEKSGRKRERGQIKSVQRLIRGVFDTGIETEFGLPQKISPNKGRNRGVLIFYLTK